MKLNLKSKFALKGSCLLLTLLLLFPFQIVFATESTDMTLNVVSSDKDTGVTVYRDAAGGLVFSGLEVPFTATKEQQMDQRAKIAEYENKFKDLHQPNATASNYVDYEYNPIYIGTWKGERCYARHTLGDYNSTLQYLTSHGYTSHYNTSGYTALPYRNGATNNGANQGFVDVAKYSYFSIRDRETNNATTLQVTDWGPSQNVHPDRIADLDTNDFASLHGNSSDGLFYSRTWVPIQNYNP